jgi:hypothetical protein
VGRIIAIILLVLAIIVAFFLLFRRLPSNQNNANPTPTPAPLGDNAAAKEFTFTVDGPIVANENYRSSTIIISSTGRKFTAYATYENQVVETYEYDNNTAAFTDFLNALQTVGSSGAPNPTPSPSPGLACPNGKRYFYTVTSGDDTVVSRQAATCGGGTASTVASPASANNLIKAQIPNINTLPGFKQFQF